MVDTGADISLVKHSCISKNSVIDKSFITNISGIGSGTIASLGIIYGKLYVQNISLGFNFRVVNSSFPIPCDGILGLDFIKNFNCILDYQNKTDTLILRPFHYKYFLKIDMFKNHSCLMAKNTISLPARSEVIRKVYLNKEENDIFIPNQLISEGIFIANSISEGRNTFVRIINTTDDNVTIDLPDIEYEPFENYETTSLPSDKPAHSSKIMEKLRKNFPKFASKALENLCNQYIDIFALESDKITTNNFYKQKLRVKDDNPIYIKNYRTPYSQKDEIKKQIEKLQTDGIIEPSVSEYNSPILLVPKKSLPGQSDKRWRLVVDYRQINKKLIADKYPLPRIDDILDQLGRAKYFSCLDLMSGFHQIELDENSRDLTSFSTNEGSFRFTRLPYGIKVAPNSFQRMMSLAFSGLAPSQAFLYMDDLVVIGCSEKHMTKNLKDVFEMCRKHNLKLHPDKCNFFNHEVTFLGHKCTSNGILPDDSKYDIIKKYPTPKNGEEAKRFIAFCNYYRRFIPNFATYSRHLTYLSKKNVTFCWTDKCEKSFNYFKNFLLYPKILQYPDFNKKFCITTDASKYACGAILSQERDGIQMPIAYASKAFTKGESNKSVIEQELTAIHWAITYFKPYVYGKRFLVKSDHRPLSYLFSLKNPSSKLIRMRLDLEEYDFEIEYIRGQDNCGADALSRIDFNSIKEITICSDKILKVTTRSSTKKELYDTKYKNVNTESIKVIEALVPWEYKNIVRMKTKIYKNYCAVKILKGKNNIISLTINGKVDLGQLFSKLEKEACSLNISKIALSLNDTLFEKHSVNKIKIIANKILQKLTLILLPKIQIINNKNKTEIEQILVKHHDDPIFGGHPGINRLVKKIRLSNYWKNMTKDIKNYVNNCKLCKLNKTLRKNKESLEITNTPQKAFETIVVDTIGPLPKSDDGNEYAITIVNYCILIYGLVKTILTDQGTEYKNDILKAVCKLLNINHLTSTAYHHETLGTVERSHRTFNEYVRNYISIDKTDWDKYLNFFSYCYNTTPSTVHDYCPYQLVFGKTPNQFKNINYKSIERVYNMDLYVKELKFRLQVAQQRASEMIKNKKIIQKSHFDTNINEIFFKEGDLVVIENASGHKLDKKYFGPYKIVEICNKNCKLIGKDKSKLFEVHKNRLKLYEKKIYEINEK